MKQNSEKQMKMLIKTQTMWIQFLVLALSVIAVLGAVHLNFYYEGAPCKTIITKYNSSQAVMYDTIEGKYENNMTNFTDPVKKLAYNLSDLNTPYQTNCAMRSAELLTRLKSDGYNATIARGWVAHAWIICHNCTWYKMWYTPDGEPIYDKNNYLLDEEIFEYEKDQNIRH